MTDVAEQSLVIVLASGIRLTAFHIACDLPHVFVQPRYITQEFVIPREKLYGLEGDSQLLLKLVR